MASHAPEAGAEIRLPGGVPAGGDGELADFGGHLVLITGSCEPVDQLAAQTYTVERVTVLGHAGQGAPDESSKPEDAHNDKGGAKDRDAGKG